MVPAVPLVILTMAVPASLLLDRARATSHLGRIEACPSCGYEVTGLPTDICPECGVDWRAAREAGSTPIIVVTESDPPARRTPGESRHEWRILRTGLRRLVWCSTITTGISWLGMQHLGTSPALFFEHFVLGVTVWAVFLLSRRKLAALDNDGAQPPAPPRGVALGAVGTGWVVWFALTVWLCSGMASA